ncbi:EamA family transporter RarD [Parachitinimonas caeni]|uniref:EamA family transporter RarD n=1 Tax=Parachitinimonas caeni TaxID=3031301 RepID=A0ABT7DXL1_9NEIS|nr:EamA family transporter RarD [Parachitinimonas caeni]MDK2124554.1 EamA family transporter RarD [Parachitinimonas caeni]
MNNGILFAALAYFCWGLLPLYLKMLQTVPAMEILLHRMVWSLVFLCAILAWRRQWSWLPAALRQPRVLLGFTASAAVLALNWFVYIWAVNAGKLVDASLGYFINPLVNVMLGFLVLKERLRPAQWFAVAVAAGGVTWLTFAAGSLPWIALVLACSFGSYGLLRKTAALGALEGLSFETLLLFPFAGGYLIYLMLTQQSGFVSGTTHTQLLLMLAGPITAIPLLLFAAGARRIPLSLLGFLQYIGPSLQLLLGVFVYNEPFSQAKMVGFALIWSALALFSIDSYRTAQQSKMAG